MPNKEEIALLSHLSYFKVSDEKTRYIAMDYETDEYLKASYSLRPLMRYDYITQRADGLYSITIKAERNRADVSLIYPKQPHCWRMRSMDGR